MHAECYCEAGEDKCMPLLRDVFEAFPSTPVNVDIKVDNDTLIKKVAVYLFLRGPLTAGLLMTHMSLVLTMVF